MSWGSAPRPCPALPLVRWRPVCYASGMEGRDIREFVIELFANRREVLSRLWDLRPKSFSDLWGMQSPISLMGQLDPEWVAESFLPAGIKKSFDDLSVPTSLSVTDYYSGTEVVMREGSVITAMAASMAIPTIFKPVQWQGKILVDGGCVNPMPVDHVRPLAGIVIAVDVIGVPQSQADREERTKPGVFEMGVGAMQILMQTIQSEKLRHDHADILIRPKIEPFRILDFLKAREILAASEGAKDEVKAKLEACLAQRSCLAQQ